MSTSFTSPLGQPVSRLDGPAKVTGQARYAAELPRPGLVHAVLVPATIGRGRIAALDAGPAERAPGVLAVLSYLNAPRLARPTPRPAGESLPVLQGPAIYYHGQYVAVVVAETLEQATHAATLLAIDYQAEVPRVDLLDPAAATVRPARRFGPSGPALQTERGSQAQGLAAAAVQLRRTYYVPTLFHHPLEPLATLAYWEGEHLTVHDTTQGVSDTRRTLAEVFGLPQAQVRVVAAYIGGGFGCKGNCWTSTRLAALAARHVGRPVRLSLTRAQMVLANGHRAQTQQELTLGATQEGHLTAIDHHTRTHTSQLDTFTEPCGVITQTLYSCPNVRTSHELVRLDVSSPTFARGPGEAGGSFALESALDELAHELGLDPLELRLRNYAERDEQADRPFSSKAQRECYRLGAERFGWAARPARPRARQQGNWLVGYGMATAAYPANFLAATASVSYRATDGRVLVRCGTQDLGTGMYTIAAQVAADALGLPLAAVSVELGDTTLPAAPMSRSSAGAASAGSAIRAAGQQLRLRLLELATQDTQAPLYGLTAAELDVADGRIFARADPARHETYRAVLLRLALPLVEATAGAAPGLERPEPGLPTPSPPQAENGQPAPPAVPQYAFHSFGAHFCEVWVDEAIGRLEVRRLLGVYGAGRILNPKTARSQLLGGLVWGRSMATHEQTHRDPRTGAVLNPDLGSYHVPVCLDVPADVQVLFVDEHDALVNPLGAKGVGELGIVGTAAAIANAVFNATGKRIRDLPVTPAKLL